MVKKQPIQQIQGNDSTSQLQQFNLAFEYDKTLQEVRRDVRTRTHAATN